MKLFNLLLATCFVHEKSFMAAFTPQVTTKNGCFGVLPFSSRQSANHQSRRQLIPLGLEDSHSLFHQLHDLSTSLPSAIISVANTAADLSDEYQGDLTLDMFLDTDGVVNPWEKIKPEDIPRDIVIEWGQFTQEVNQLASLNDLLFKAPFAAVILGLCDFAINRFAVSDVEEQMRQDEMIGDYEQEDAFFFGGLKIRLVALILVTVSTVLISKWTYHGPFPEI